MIPPIDIDVDWNTQDDTGLPWTFADDADRIVPGAFVVAGRGRPSQWPKSLIVTPTAWCTYVRFQAPRPPTCTYCGAPARKAGELLEARGPFGGVIDSRQTDDQADLLV